MLYFLDTEFVEDGSTIMPISLGIVSEDCRELYLELGFDEDKAQAHDFVREHVLPHLYLDNRLSRQEAREAILEFIGEDPDPQFWAYFADYDWVLLCQIFGTMMDLPERFPKFCMDLQQWYVRLGRPKGVKPPKPKNAHNALADAQWNFEFYKMLSGEIGFMSLEPDSPPVSNHLNQAKYMAENGDIEGAIRHTFWHAYHVGNEDGSRLRGHTHSDVYNAEKFLFEILGKTYREQMKETKHERKG